MPISLVQKMQLTDRDAVPAPSQGGQRAPMVGRKLYLDAVTYRHLARPHDAHDPHRYGDKRSQK